ncbi:Putative TPR repeat protein [[Torrubiella] hemipterigena]|uniref:Putative TPR repeat protein n=1 Tax=[Torrubiella] hemipterigena TaxID=1531966 RepID=A0A0A1TAI6_9HYPO|nr:Putative TPR repeat protein [[Torrubiella] hemipterigena]
MLQGYHCVFSSCTLASPIVMSSRTSAGSVDSWRLPMSAMDLPLGSTISGVPQLASSSSERPSRKRKATASTWAHARDPTGLEPSRCGRKNEKIYYCRYCINPTYSTSVSTTFRNHLFKVHDIEVEAAEHPVKRQRDRLIQDAFAKAGEVHAAKRLAGEEVVLRDAVNPKAAREALVQLVTVRNLSYNCSSWPELHALISAVNPMADDVISLSNGSIQKLVASSYSVHKDILRRKLQSTPWKLHLSADVWSAPNHKAFLGICVRFVDPDAKEALQALLALPELSRMAVDILSVPAMSAEPERVFSGARRTISWDRCQLGAQTIKKGECMKSWIKSGITKGNLLDGLNALDEDAGGGDSGEKGEHAGWASPLTESI